MESEISKKYQRGKQIFEGNGTKKNKTTGLREDLV